MRPIECLGRIAVRNKAMSPAAARATVAGGYRIIAMKESGGVSREDQPTALLMSFTRSVFSQEKPPSLSGARPKWP
jgi:hypothetical protein